MVFFFVGRDGKRLRHSHKAILNPTKAEKGDKIEKQGRGLKLNFWAFSQKHKQIQRSPLESRRVKLKPGMFKQIEEKHLPKESFSK